MWLWQRYHVHLAVFYETVRLWPGLPKNARVALCDDILPAIPELGLPEVKVDKGDYVFWSDYVMMRDETVSPSSECCRLYLTTLSGLGVGCPAIQPRTPPRHPWPLREAKSTHFCRVRCRSTIMVGMNYVMIFMVRRLSHELHLVRQRNSLRTSSSRAGPEYCHVLTSARRWRARQDTQALRSLTPLR